MEQPRLNESNDPFYEESRKEDGDTIEVTPKKERRIFFETKTMAEVYAKQGHTMIALEIYKRIFQKNPLDSEAQKKISELETKLSSKRDKFTKPQAQGNSK